MKIYEKIQQYEDTKQMSKQQIIDNCYQYKMCPLDIEMDFEFIGPTRFNDLCHKNQCGIECLEEYIELEIE